MNKNIFHILVVDDDDRIRNLLKQYLEENQFIVTTARNAIDAKTKIEIIKYKKRLYFIEEYGNLLANIRNEKIIKCCY